MKPLIISENLKFDEKSITLYPGLYQLPDLSPVSYLVCGSVSGHTPQKIEIKNVNSSIILMIATEPITGKFCQYLTIGKYEIKVIVNESPDINRIQ